MTSYDHEPPDLSAAIREGQARINAASVRSVPFLTDAVERWPENAELHGLLALALILDDRHAEALPELRISAELSWDDANALFSAAEYAALVDRELSWTWVTRIREIFDYRDFEHLEELTLLVAELTSKMGDKGLRQARDLLVNVIAQDPDSDVRYSIALAHVHHLMQEPDAAAEIARTALNRWPDDRELRALADGSPLPAPIGPTSVIAPRTVASLSATVNLRRMAPRSGAPDAES